MSSEAAGILKACSCSICFQDGAPTLAIVGRKPQFLAMCTFPEACFSVLMTCQLATSRVSYPRVSKMEVTVFFVNVGPKVPLSHFCRILLFTQFSIVQCGKRLYKGKNAKRREAHREPSWKLVLVA